AHFGRRRRLLRLPVQIRRRARPGRRRPGDRARGRGGAGRSGLGAVPGRIGGRFRRRPDRRLVPGGQSERHRLLRLRDKFLDLSGSRRARRECAFSTRVLMRAVENATGPPPETQKLIVRRRLAIESRSGPQGDTMKKTAIIAVAFAMTSSTALAQSYPNKAITMLVPFAAGGPTDTVARVTAQSMSKLLGQPIIIENALGAGGTIATTRASRAEPDGYTLLIHHIGM